MSEIEPLSAEMEVLLEAARDAPGPAAPIQARVWERLEADIGFPPPPGGGEATAPVEATTAAAPAAPAAPTAATGAAAASAAVKLVGALGVVVAAAIGAVALQPTAKAPTTPTPASTPAAVPVPVPVNVPLPLPMPVPAPPVPAPVPPSTNDNPAASPEPPRPTRTAIDDALRAEQRLLADASRALRSGAPDRALATLSAHTAAHPRGRLTEERDALRVRALVAAGRVAEARTHAADFRRRHPGSLLLDTVESALPPR